MSELREKILKLLHETESCAGCKDHYKKPHKCDMDLAAPRCARRVKGLEQLFQSELEKAKKMEKIAGRHAEIMGIIEVTEFFTKKRNKQVYNLYLPVDYLKDRVDALLIDAKELKSQKGKI